MADGESREASKGTPYEPLWDTPDHWPGHVRRMPDEEIGKLGIDPKTKELFHDGHPIVTKKRWAHVERLIAVTGVAAAVTGAISGFALAVVEIGRATGWWQ